MPEPENHRAAPELDADREEVLKLLYFETEGFDMSINELIHVVPPPKKITDRATKSKWKALSRVYGISFPEDIYEFGATYGTGFFCGGYIEVYNPFWHQYNGQIDYELSSLRNETIPVPYMIHPDSPGLFPIGRDENSGNLYWLTEGKPENWPIVLSDRMRVCERWDMHLTTFLAKVFRNKIKTILWESPFQAGELTFNSKRG